MSWRPDSITASLTVCILFFSAGNNGSDTSFSSATMKYKGSSKYCNETLHGGKLVDITDTKAQIENRGLSETPIWVGSVNEAKLIRGI